MLCESLFHGPKKVPPLWAEKPEWCLEYCRSWKNTLGKLGVVHARSIDQSCECRWIFADIWMPHVMFTFITQKMSSRNSRERNLWDQALYQFLCCAYHPDCLRFSLLAFFNLLNPFNSGWKLLNGVKLPLYIVKRYTKEAHWKWSTTWSTQRVTLHAERLFSQQQSKRSFFLQVRTKWELNPYICFSLSYFDNDIFLQAIYPEFQDDNRKLVHSDKRKFNLITKLKKCFGQNMHPLCMEYNIFS